MFVMDRPRGRTAHHDRVHQLRILESTGLIQYHETLTQKGKRYYIISYNERKIMLRETDIEPYILGISSIIHKLTENHIEGLKISLSPNPQPDTLTP